MQARRNAENAHIVFVNHSLLLSDLAADSNVLPAHDRLNASMRPTTSRTSQPTSLASTPARASWNTLLDGIAPRGRERESGLVSEVRSATRGPHMDADRSYLEGLLRDAVERTDRARRLAPETFGILGGFAQQHGEDGGRV